MIEIVIDVENTFQISIPDQDANEMTTVGDMYEYILNATGSTHSTACLTSRTFYRVRRGLMDVLGIKRNDVTPNTRLSDLIQDADLRTTWRRLEQSVGMKLPLLGVAVLSRPRVPDYCRTVADLTRLVIRENSGLLSSEGQVIPRSEIWPMLRSIVASDLAVSEGKVTRDAEFVRDLGAG